LRGSRAQPFEWDEYNGFWAEHDGNQLVLMMIQQVQAPYCPHKYVTLQLLIKQSEISESVCFFVPYAWPHFSVYFSGILEWSQTVNLGTGCIAALRQYPDALQCHANS